jgi:hypothetical protein
MWSFVGKKAPQRWLWHAIDHTRGVILADVCGVHEDEVFLQLKKYLRPFGISQFYTDNAGVYTHNSRKFGAVPNMVVRSCALARREPCGANGWPPRSGPCDRCRRGARRSARWP